MRSETPGFNKVKPKPEAKKQQIRLADLPLRGDVLPGKRQQSLE
jgi:hypothetical protein